MKVLVVDDEPNIRESVKRFLELEGMEADCAANGMEGLSLLLDTAYDAVVLDLRMPVMDGMELLEKIREDGFRVPVIMISAHGEINDAVLAMKSGADDYIVKPFDADELLLRLSRVVDGRRRKDVVDSSKLAPQAGLVGESDAMKRIRSMIRRIAPVESTVLITGENGSGKEVVARSIHSLSRVSNGPFVAVNVGGVPDNLVESELFGFEKGAFTGASSRKEGLFELATSGTLFLDEIGEMPAHLQVKLLRVLQERKIRRLGGTRDIPVSARFMAATNRDLDLMVKQGTFREDLFFRLNVVPIRVPPLRERMEDLRELCGNAIGKLNLRMGKSVRSLSEDAFARLTKYRFPGNVRELENMLERAMIFAEGDMLESCDFEISLDSPAILPPGSSMKNAERNAIAEALGRSGGNRTKAAEELGISRRTIITKIRDFGLE